MEEIYDNYEVHPCEIIGIDSSGQIMMEQCPEDSPNIDCWGVYGHIPNGGLEWLDDFDTKAEADQFCLALRQLKVQNAE